jgi:hypothetical protein
MRCSCGKEGLHWLSRRETPYCQACFEHLIVSSVRKEAGPGAVRLKPVQGYFLSAVEAACRLAGKDVEHADDGFVPGCTETAAAAVVAHLLGHAQKEEHFPKTITLQELQTFFKAEQPVILSALAQELVAFDKAYPGTTRSIVKHTDDTPQAR